MSSDAKDGAKDAAAPEKPEAGPQGAKLSKGVAMGIGSAAIVAALLYANRRRKDGKQKR